MSRPKGLTLNPDALDDWLVARGLTRSEFAAAADLVPSTVTGMARAGSPKGASLPVALRMAEVLRVRPGSLFPDLIGRVEPEPAVAQ